MRIKLYPLAYYQEYRHSGYLSFMHFDWEGEFFRIGRIIVAWGDYI